MDKATIIDQIGNYLGAASAVECSLVLTFLQHMIPAGGQEPGHGFVLSNPTAAEIVYIINRNADNERFLRELLTQAVVYLSVAPKSNSIDRAYAKASRDALSMLDEPVPLALRNAPTRLMKELDYGKGYQFAHHTEEKLTNMHCLPDSLLGRTYYEPGEHGLETKFKARLEYIKAWKKEHEAQAQEEDADGTEQDEQA